MIFRIEASKIYIISMLCLVFHGNLSYALSPSSSFNNSIDSLSIHELRDLFKQGYLTGRIHFEDQFDNWSTLEIDPAGIKGPRKKSLVGGLFILRKIKGKWGLLLGQRSKDAKDFPGYYSAPVGGIKSSSEEPSTKNEENLQTLKATGMLKDLDIDTSGKRESIPLGALREAGEEIFGFRDEISGVQALNARINHFRGHHEGILVNFFVYVSDVTESEVIGAGENGKIELDHFQWVPLSYILSFSQEEVGEKVEEYLKKQFPNNPLMKGLKFHGMRNLQHLLQQTVYAPENRLDQMLMNEGIVSRTEILDEKTLKIKIKNWVYPETSYQPDPRNLENVILPHYIPGPFTNGQVLNKPEWEGNIQFPLKLFARELKKAMYKGLIIPEPQVKLDRFRQLYEAWREWRDENGQRFYLQLTNTENTKITERLTRFVLFGTPEQRIDHHYQDVANTANHVTSLALQDSLFSKTLTEFENPTSTIADRQKALRNLLKMAVWASAPNIWFSNPDVQSDLVASVAQTKDLFQDALHINLAIDHIDKFTHKALNIEETTKLLYFVDDNGDLLYHLHLMQSYLKLNSKLQITVVAKKGAQGIDANNQIIEALVDSENTLGNLKNYLTQNRFVILKEGPSFSGPNIKKASQELLTALNETDAIMAVGQSATENLNGICKPLFLMSYVDSNVCSMVTGLAKGSIFFAHIAPNQYFYQVYDDKKEKYTLVDTKLQQFDLPDTLNYSHPVFKQAS